jgi:cysteine desulfurase family protein (TIGR01976 family)
MVDAAIDAMTARIRAGASNTHGVFPVSEEIDALIADARAAGADFLGCDADEVVFGQNTTSLLFHLSRALGRTWGPGDEIVVTRLDHDANVRTWLLAAEDAGATVRWVDVRRDDVTLDVDSFDAALSDRTRLVAFTLASNAVGTIPPAADLVARAKARGALVAVDGVHLAQHRAIDLHGLGADIVATSPYKYFGPHQGMLGVRSELLASLRPYKLRAAEDVDPSRWETGTQNHEALAGTIAAIGYLAELGGEGDADRRAAVVAGFDRIAAHEHELAARFLEGIARMGGVRLVGIADPARVRERTPTFAVLVRDQHPLDTSRSLAERGIFTWDGHYYAIEVFDRLGLLAGGGAVRIGFCHYHTLDEVDLVLDALGDLAG